MKSLILEYRLWKNNDSYVPLYHYNDIEMEQILARRECEFFIKDGVTYKQLSSSIEGSVIAIYVEESEINQATSTVLTNNEMIKLEIRELDHQRTYPLLDTKYFYNHSEVLLYIGAIYTYSNGLEWERDSAELDEDQLAYVLYVKPTGYKWEGDSN